jgi:hypothetical protein
LERWKEKISAVVSNTPTLQCPIESNLMPPVLYQSDIKKIHKIRRSDPLSEALYKPAMILAFSLKG